MGHVRDGLKRATTKSEFKNYTGQMCRIKCACMHPEAAWNLHRPNIPFNLNIFIYDYSYSFLNGLPILQTNV